MDLLQVSLLINKQRKGKKKNMEGKREGERDLWTTCSENETGQDLDRRLSLMLAEEPIKVEQVNAEPRFRNAWSTSLALLPISLPFSSSFLPFVHQSRVRLGASPRCAAEGSIQLSRR